MFIYQGYPNYWLQLQLLEKYPELKYCVGFQINLEKQQVSFSIRSKYQNDCAKIANNFDGGGHQKAAGFKMKLNHAIKLIQNPQLIFLYKKFSCDVHDFKVPSKGNNFFLTSYLHNNDIIEIVEVDEKKHNIKFKLAYSKSEVSDWIDWDLLENRPFCLDIV